MNIDKLIPDVTTLQFALSFGSLMNIDKLILRYATIAPHTGFGSLMNIDKLMQPSSRAYASACFGSLMNIDKLILRYATIAPHTGFGSLMNIKLKETACGILFCKLLFYNQRGDRGTAFFGII